MSEKLIIRNFGPITNVELDLRKVNVLIGESGTGKSTIAKVLAFCKYFTNIQGAWLDRKNGETINVRIEEIENNLKKVGLFEYINNGTFVSYECNDYIFSFYNRLIEFAPVNLSDDKYPNSKEYALSSFIKPISTRFEKLLTEYIRLDEIGSLNADFFEKSIGAIMDNPFFVYGERVLQSHFSMGKDFTSNLSDPLFRFFVNIDKIQRNYKNITEINPLKIEYKNIEGRGEVRKKGESKFISLNNAASGYMSVIPIVLIIKYYKEFRKKKKSFIIEEPELSIFPSTQNELVKFIAESLGNIDNLLITTHSPYILTSLNNLMYAHKVGKIYPEEAEKVIDRKYWLNPNDVSVYKLVVGESVNIIDEDLKQIKVEEIDEISDILSAQWHEMAELNMVKN